MEVLFGLEVKFTGGAHLNDTAHYAGEPHTLVRVMFVEQVTETMKKLLLTPFHNLIVFQRAVICQPATTDMI